MRDESRTVKQIIKRYGSVIDLEKDPHVIIDIIRTFSMQDDGGPDDGGPPPGPPGPSSHQGKITNVDLMKELLKVSREISKLRKEVGQ